MQSRLDELEFHLAVRKEQAGDWIDHAVILKELEDLYSVRRKPREEEVQCDFSVLPGDMLASIFACLSFEERNTCRLVCRHWSRKAFARDDPRILRGSIWKKLSNAEVVSFLAANRTVTRLGRVGWDRLSNLLVFPGFPASRIAEIRVSDEWQSSRVVGALMEATLGGLLGALPNLEEVRVYVKSPMRHVVVTPSLRVFRYYFEGNKGVRELKLVKCDTLQELELDDGAYHNLQEIMTMMPNLKALTVMPFVNADERLVPSQLKQLSFLISREQFVRGSVNTDIHMMPLTHFSGRITSGMEQLPFSLTSLRLEEGSNVDNAESLPPQLRKLDAIEVIADDAFCERVSRLKHLEELKVCIGSKSYAWFNSRLETSSAFSCLTRLSIKFTGEMDLLYFPPSLRFLELEGGKGLSFASMRKCVGLREIVIRNCFPRQNRADWECLPRNLFRLSIEMEYNHRVFYTLTVREWIRLPPFICNMPRIDSVLERLVQFQ